MKKDIPGSAKGKKDSKILKFLLLNNPKERKEISPAKCSMN